MPGVLEVRRPRLLDLCCCQGGAGHGYMRAGFDVTGVDIVAQPRYPYRIRTEDALTYLDAHWREYDAFHASPPCQGYSETQRLRGNDHPLLIEPFRERFESYGRPWVIENVRGAPLLEPIELCGLMFGLHTFRHRLFETSFPVEVPFHMPHPAATIKMGRPVRTGDFYHAVGNFSDPDGWIRKDLGMPWMNRDGLRESIPWQYAHHVGTQMRRWA